LIVASVFHYVYIVEGQYGGTKAIIVRRTLAYTKQPHFCRIKIIDAKTKHRKLNR
jgi:hypothetical protein